MSRGDRVALVQVLYALLQQDGAYGPEEEAFFERLVEQLGFDAAERTAATTLLSPDAAERTARSLPLSLRRGQVEALIEGALVDADLDGRERELIERIADALDVDDETRDWLWEKVARQLDVSL